MKKIVINAFMLFLLAPCASNADIVKFETNIWSDSRPLIWTGTLTKIDPTLNIAHFEYKNGDNIELFSVHVTRIYSLTLDNQDRVNRSFPKVRQDISLALPTNPRSKRKLELSNVNFVTDDIPHNVRVRPNRSNDIIYLNGRVLSADTENFSLEARAEKGTQQSFEIARSDLRRWIR